MNAVLQQPVLGLSHQASGVLGHLDFFARLLRVADEMLQNARDLRRCASNRIQVDGLLPNAATAPSLDFHGQEFA